MSGQAGVRGYFLQTIVCVLDALRQDVLWNSITLEPNISSDKVDIVWHYPQFTKVTQVKSSQNQISKSQAVQWANELEQSIVADYLELILIGPCSQAVVDLKIVGKVTIPIPKILDISALIEQSAHRLDLYLESRGTSSIPAFARELVVSALISKFEAYSTNGTPIARDDFRKIIDEWLLSIYPQSINEAVQMQCDLLCDTIVFALPTVPSPDSFGILLPITLVNYGIRTTIIEWIIIRIDTDINTKLYTPVAFVDYELFIRGMRAIHASNIKSHFSEFAVSRGSEREICILFLQEENNDKYPFSDWKEGQHTFRVYVKYRDKDIPSLQRELEIYIDNEIIQQYKTGTSIVQSVRDIVF